MNSVDATARARISPDRWLELAVPLSGSELDEAAWSLLALNATLTGAARVAATPGDRLHVRAEAFLGDPAESTNRDDAIVVPVDPTTCARALSADVRQALDRLRRSAGLPWSLEPEEEEPEEEEEEGEGDGPVERQSADVDSHIADLARWCEEAGWPVVRRASGDLLVTVDPGRDLLKARLTRPSEDAFSAVVLLSDAPVVSPLGRAALSRLLLRASSVVRLTKGVVVRREGLERVGIAAASSPPRSADDVDRILAALTVACRLTYREVAVLSDKAIARAYLSPGPAPSSAHAVREPLDSRDESMDAIEPMEQVEQQEASTCLHQP